MIRKLASGGYRLYSRKKDPKTGKRRNLGTFKTRPDDARRDLELAFQEQAGSLDVLLALGELYRTTGESAKAQQMHERAVQFFKRRG